RQRVRIRPHLRPAVSWASTSWELEHPQTQCRVVGQAWALATARLRMLPPARLGSALDAVRAFQPGKGDKVSSPGRGYPLITFLYDQRQFVPFSLRIWLIERPMDH